MMKLKLKTYHGIVLLPVAVIIFHTLSVYRGTFYSDTSKYWYITHQDDFNGIVLRNDSYTNRSLAILKLENKSKTLLIEWAENIAIKDNPNYNNGDFILGNYVQLGDSVYKKPYSDTIFVVRKTQTSLDLRKLKEPLTVPFPIDERIRDRTEFQKSKYLWEHFFEWLESQKDK